MIDPMAESVKLAVKLDFHRDKAPSIQTVCRWILTGMRAIDGRRVTLEAIKIGSSWYSSQQAVERLIQAVNTPKAQSLVKTPKQRAAQNEAAKLVLEAAGV